MTTELPEKPLSRKESYLAKIAGEDVTLPEAPESRTEQYLAYIAENGGGGGGGGTNNFNQLTNRPKYNNTTMTGNTNIPKVPTKNSELSNDSGYITSSDLPTVNDATLTITQNGVSAGTFTANDADDTTIALTDTTYSNFTGTDGTAAGTAGLVPAPATTDAGKFLKADGTWDTAGGGGGPTVVQTMGTSTTDVMSQNATTSMVYADPATQTQIKIGSGTYVNEGTDGIEIGHGAEARGNYAVVVGGGSAAKGISSVAIGNGITDNLTQAGATALGSNTRLGGQGSVALGAGSYAPNVQGVVQVGPTSTWTEYGFQNTQYRVIRGVFDGQNDHDAATKGQLDSIAIRASGAPTTLTVGAVGTLYEDTTNGKLYQCTAVTESGDTTTYTWAEVGAGGSGPTVVQTKGTSTTDVMSQNAVSTLIFPDPSSSAKIRIGNNTTLGDYSVVIGFNASSLGGSSDTVIGANTKCNSTYGTVIGRAAEINTNATGSIAIGEQATVTANHAGAIALGAFSQSTRSGELNIGSSDTSLGFNTSNYRLISGVYDGQAAHDAVTVEQVNATIDAINAALSTNIPHIGA